MVSGLTKIFLIPLLIVSLGASAFAQTPSDGSNSKPSSSGPRKQLATILFAGLGGAILGLSTLSFYGRPQDKLSNIAIGFAFGVIAGTSYVTYKAATNPSEIYGLEPLKRHDLAGRGLGESGVAPVGASWQFEF